MGLPRPRFHTLEGAPALWRQLSSRVKALMTIHIQIPFHVNAVMPDAKRVVLV